MILSPQQQREISCFGTCIPIKEQVVLQEPRTEKFGCSPVRECYWDIFDPADEWYFKQVSHGKRPFFEFNTIKKDSAYQKLLELRDKPFPLIMSAEQEDRLALEMAEDYKLRKHKSKVQELFADKAKKEDGEPMSLTKHCYIINARNMKTGEQHTFYPKRGDLSRFLKEPRSIARCSFDTDNIMDLDEVQEFIDENLVGKFRDLVVSKVVEHIKIKFESQLDKCA